MDRGAESDLFLLADEKFDFDVSLSPASSDGDEDEVFVGPVSHKERFAAVNAASRPEAGGAAWGSWRPLSGDQLQEMCREAHRLADQLQGSELSEDAATTVAVDGFVRGAEAKLGVLCQAAGALSPIKRQTFCVQDSPMKQLPPAVQRRLLRGSGANTPTSTRPAATRHAVAASPARPAAASPAVGVKPLPRTGLRGRAALSVAVVLPSKPVATTTTTTTSCPAGRGGAEKPRMQPPSRPLGSWRRSPSCSAVGSCEDLLSDSASVASDVSDSSLNASLLGKRTLAPPTKRALMNPSGVKAPPLQRRRMTERKNSSSSSSSVSSFNSSLSLSPAAGKLNSRSQSGSTGPAPISRPRRSTAYAPAEPPSSSSATGRRCSLSTQARKLSEAERVKAARPAALKRAEATPLQLTPAKRVLERAASNPAAARLQSGLKTKSKPEASVVPTPSGGGRHGDAPDVSKPKRLMSGVDSLPQTPSAGSRRSRRPSALPTPVRRRMSSIPLATPTRPPPTFDPASARSERSCSPAPAHTQEAELVDVHTFCLEEEEPPAAPPPASPPPQPDQSESTDPGDLHQGGSEPSRNLIELETTEESKTQEVLLLDLPAPTLRPQEKLLIDLTNTPDLIRTSGNTCTATQLIDLSSPLIKWSPDEKRENNAPLINLSF
ncbi:G2 and S phase-expressed protein 1 isoform X2 [Cyclopterus lumpus]|nr:G2 and S phase-expressed protein 1 isoform X2 [Cyclopterus lumpus]